MASDILGRVPPAEVAGLRPEEIRCLWGFIRHLVTDYGRGFRNGGAGELLVEIPGIQ